MNYLELVQALHRESGTGGPTPASVTGLQGEALRLRQWVDRADVAIQSMHSDWDFLWSTGSFLTQADLNSYPYPADLAVVDEDTVFVDDGSGQPYRIDCVDYLTAKKDPVEDTPGRPYRLVMLPDRRFRVEGMPDGAYTITYDYFVLPASMVLDDLSVSVIPAAYHNAIIGRALMMYGRYENAPDAVDAGAAMFAEQIQLLESHQLPGTRDMHKQAEGNEFGVHVE